MDAHKRKTIVLLATLVLFLQLLVVAVDWWMGYPSKTIILSLVSICVSIFLLDKLYSLDK